MTITNRIIEHYNSLAKLVIHVPEWGENDQPLEVHVSPVTMAEMGTIQRLTKKNATNFDYAVTLLFLKAKDQNGNRLFKVEDKDTLLNQADYRVVFRVAEKIQEHFFSDGETIKGNSEETPSASAS